MLDDKDHQFERALAQAEDEGTLKILLEEYSKHLRFETFSFGMRLWLPNREAKTIFWANYPSEWTSEYDQRGYIKVDPVVLYAFNNCVPALWSDLEMDAAGRKLMQRAAAYGVDNGITVPLSIPPDTFAILSLSRSTKQDISSHLSIRLKQRLLWFGYAFAGRCISVINGEFQAQAYNLTSREQEALMHASRGLSVIEIAQEMGVTTSTVRYFFTQAGKRLGVSGKNACVNKAQALGVLNVRDVEVRAIGRFKLRD